MTSPSFLDGNSSLEDERSLKASSAKARRLRKVRREESYPSASIHRSRSLNDQETLEMRYWGLPELVLMRYRQKGIVEMFEWQRDCLETGDVLKGNNT